MTIKELKNNILLALYKRYKEGEMASVGFAKQNPFGFCIS